MILINDILIKPNPVNVKGNAIISVEIITWDYLRDRYTWQDLKASGGTWESLRRKAVIMDFTSTWESANEKYTWNSLKRYPTTWNELKGV